MKKVLIFVVVLSFTFLLSCTNYLTGYAIQDVPTTNLGSADAVAYVHSIKPLTVEILEITHWDYLEHDEVLLEQGDYIQVHFTGANPSLQPGDQFQTSLRCVSEEEFGPRTKDSCFWIASPHRLDLKGDWG